MQDQMSLAYLEGMNALDRNDVLFASKKFNEAELLYPQSEWAPKASLMSAYAYYKGQYYQDSISELKRFLEFYPKNSNLDYAYYLLAMNYYKSIVDEKKDLKPLLESQKYFSFVKKNYPKTDYALDAKYKLDLIQDLLAAKELYLARYYMNKKKWIPAMNRLKKITKEYDTTIYVEEALHRLVEVNYILGLENEAKIYATALGYNYQSSDWYRQSYKIFNKDYSVSEKKKFKENKKLLEKIRSLF